MFERFKFLQSLRGMFGEKAEPSQDSLAMSEMYDVMKKIMAGKVDENLALMAKNIVQSKASLIQNYTGEEFVYDNDHRLLPSFIESFLTAVGYQFFDGKSSKIEELKGHEKFDILADGKRFMAAYIEIFKIQYATGEPVKSQDAKDLVDFAQGYLLEHLEDYMPKIETKARPTHLQVIVNNDKPPEPENP